MTPLPRIFEKLRTMDPDRALGLHPPYPPVAVQVSPRELSLVRMKPQRRGLPQLEAFKVVPVEQQIVPGSIFQPAAAISPEELTGILSRLFEETGTRPGRLSLVIPDNLAKITLLNLPEAPANRRQLSELIRAQMRRSVPFRLEDARISYQVLPSAGSGVSILVVVARTGLIEQYEKALSSLGAQVGLVDLCTPNLINLCRARFEAASRDMALLNCAQGYFSLAIIRAQRVIFLRCKSYAVDEDDPDRGPNGMLLREIGASMSYYEDKLEGNGIGGIFVRSPHLPVDEIARKLEPLGLGPVLPVDPGPMFEPAEGARRPDDRLLQQLAPAIGAAVGRK